MVPGPWPSHRNRNNPWKRECDGKGEWKGQRWRIGGWTFSAMLVVLTPRSCHRRHTAGRFNELHVDTVVGRTPHTPMFAEHRHVLVTNFQ